MEQLITTTRQLGIVLRGYRKSKRFTQITAAERVGLQPKTISLLELSAGRSSVESLFKLLSSLDLELVLRPKPLPSAVREPSDPEW